MSEGKVMDLKLKHSTDEILEHEFKSNTAGYDALEVDMYMDEIVQDYYAIQQYSEKAEARLKELEKENHSLKEQKDKFEAENAVLSEKIKMLSANESGSLANIDLLKRISVLEQALYKLGKDPTKIKNSDPDNR